MKKLFVTLAAMLAINFAGNAQNIYVADYSANTIDEIIPTPEAASTFASGLDNPFGIAVDSSGDVFVSDDGTGNIYKYTQAGVQSIFATAPPYAHGLACDSADNLYVANAFDNTITKITPNGVQSTFASGLNFPNLMSFDNAENLYVANYGNGTITKITPAGAQSTVASGMTLLDGTAVDSAGNVFASEGTGVILKFTGGVQSTFATGLGGPNALAFDSQGNLIVSDSGSGSIFKYTPGGVRSTLASGLEQPIGLALVAGNPQNIFVADYSANTIDEITPGGVTTFASGLNNPFGIAVNSSGNVFVSDDGTGNIYQYTPAGVQSIFATAPAYAHGLACDSSNNLYVDNAFANTITRITPAGVQSTFASGLNFPNLMSFDNAGNLYVANYGNGSVTKITPAGVQSTVASGMTLLDGTAVDSAGNVFASEGTGVILKFTGGVQSTFATGLGGPNALAFDSQGNLIVSDSGSGSIYKFTPGGVRSTLASGLEQPIGLAVTPTLQVDTILDFHSEGVNANQPFSFGLSSNSWGNTNLWFVGSDSANKTFDHSIFSNVMGPDIAFDQPVVTPDGHTQSSTGTNWLRGWLSEGTGGSIPDGDVYLQYNWSGSSICEAVAYVMITNLDAPAQNSRDLFSFYDNPYAVAEVNMWNANVGVVGSQLLSGVHSSQPNINPQYTRTAPALPTNIWLQLDLIQDRTNGFTMVSYKNALTKEHISTSIAYKVLDGTKQDQFRVEEGYIYLPTITGCDYRGPLYLNTSNVQTNRPPWVPNAPSNVSITQNGSGKIYVSWTDNSFQMNPAHIDLSDNGTYVNDVTNAAPWTNGVTISGLTTGHTYKVRVYDQFQSNGNNSAKVESASVTIAPIPDTIFVESVSGGFVVANNYEGFEFTVGASPITVTALGAFADASDGNTTATVTIRDSSCATAIATAGVDTSVHDGTYHYASISPVTLTAGASYIITIDNAVVANANVTFMTTVDATVISDNFGTCGGGVYGPGYHMVQGPNFKYH